jgi:hypothetical protein
MVVKNWIDTIIELNKEKKEEKKSPQNLQDESNNTN